MKTILVRYKTREEHALANLQRVQAVFEDLHARGPSGIRYDSYRLSDGLTFLHLATIDDPEENPLTTLPAFQAFVRELKDRCFEPPVVTDLSPVGSYR